MTPRDVDQLSNAEYAVMTDYAEKIHRDNERAARSRRKRR